MPLKIVLEAWRGAQANEIADLFPSEKAAVNNESTCSVTLIGEHPASMSKKVPQKARRVEISLLARSVRIAQA